MRSVTLARISMLLAAVVPSARAQSSSSVHELKLTQDFTFTLGTHRDRSVQEIIATMTSRDEAQRSLELQAANESVFTRAIDVLRFVPFKMGSSDMKSDEFFTPNYLRIDYERPPSEPQLFDQR